MVDRSLAPGQWFRTVRRPADEALVKGDPPELSGLVATVTSACNVLNFGPTSAGPLRRRRHLMRKPPGPTGRILLEWSTDGWWSAWRFHLIEGPRGRLSCWAEKDRGDDVGEWRRFRYPGHLLEQMAKLIKERNDP